MTSHVFISYATSESETAMTILERLEANAIRCWIASRDIHAGALYPDSLMAALQAADAVVVVLSRAAVRSPYVYREIERAVSRNIPILQVRTDDATLSGGLELLLSASQWIDVQSGLNEAEWHSLLIALREILNPSRQRRPRILSHSPTGMELVHVPAGRFMMGGDDRKALKNELPASEVTLGSYWIGRTPVTNAQYLDFVNAAGIKPPRFWDRGDLGAMDRPVVGVTWFEAKAYCAWAGLRLPTEAEWERAARPESTWMFPWGSALPTPTLANFDRHFKSTSACGSAAGSRSWVGCHDMAGNVWEWVHDWYAPYSSESKVNPSGPESGIKRVLRGGSWRDSAWDIRCSRRRADRPWFFEDNVGFRAMRPHSLND